MYSHSTPALGTLPNTHVNYQLPTLHKRQRRHHQSSKEMGYRIEIQNRVYYCACVQICVTEEYTEIREYGINSRNLRESSSLSILSSVQRPVSLFTTPEPSSVGKKKRNRDGCNTETVTVSK